MKNTIETPALELVSEIVKVEEVKTIKTTKEKLDELLAKKKALDLKVSAYQKQYNLDHNITGRNKIKEIIELHLQGLTNNQIIEKGYNKGTVGRQVGLFKKGKKMESTTIKKFLPVKEKK